MLGSCEPIIYLYKSHAHENTKCLLGRYVYGQEVQYHNSKWRLILGYVHYVHLYNTCIFQKQGLCPRRISTIIRIVKKSDKKVNVPKPELGHVCKCTGDLLIYMHEPYPKRTWIRSIYYNDAVQTRQVYKDKLRLQMNEKSILTIRQCSPSPVK